MCRCTPEMRTPFCGKPGCEWPEQKENPVNVQTPTVPMDLSGNAVATAAGMLGIMPKDCTVYCPTS